MKNVIKLLIALIAIIGFIFIACDENNGETHTHSYSETWSKDSTQHWKECSCGDKTQITNHTGNPCVVCSYDSSGNNNNVVSIDGIWNSSFGSLAGSIEISGNNYISKKSGKNWGKGNISYNGSGVTLTSTHAWSNENWSEFIEIVTGNYIIANDFLTLIGFTGRYSDANGVWLFDGNNNTTPKPVSGNMGNYSFGLQEDGVSIDYKLAVWNLSNANLALAKTNNAQLVVVFATKTYHSLNFAWQDIQAESWWNARTISTSNSSQDQNATWNEETRTLTINLPKALFNYSDFLNASQMNFVFQLRGDSINNINNIGIVSVNLIGNGS